MLSNTVHVFIIHLECYCHKIIKGLQIKVRIRVLYNSLDFRARHSCANRLLFSTFLFASLRSNLHVGLWCGAICGACLVVCAKEFFAWLRSLFSPNACLCDDWGKYSGISNCHQEAHVWGGNLLFYPYILSVVQPCRVFSNTASIDYVCNLVLSFLFSWSISCFLKLAFYFV